MFAFSIVMPQKSGTRWAQEAWQVISHSKPRLSLSLESNHNAIGPTAAFLGVLASKGEHVATVTAPISPNVGDCFEAVRNTVVDFVFVGFLRSHGKLVPNRSAEIESLQSPHYSSRCILSPLWDNIPDDTCIDNPRTDTRTL